MSKEMLSTSKEIPKHKNALEEKYKTATKLTEEKDANMIINEEVMTNYLEQIVLLLNEILDVNIPFVEKVA